MSKLNVAIILQGTILVYAATLLTAYACIDSC